MSDTKATSPEQLKLGAFVTTYKRDEILPSTLTSILQQSVSPTTILVIDNANQESTANAVAAMNDSRIQYMASPENGGAAGGASIGIKWATEQDFDWVYWGDDDDPPGDNRAFERLLACVTNVDFDNVGAIGATGARWSWTSGKAQRLSDGELSGVVEVDYIGGGQTFLISRSAMEKTEPPAANLFFSYEDLEYCLRIQRQGLKVLADGDQMMEKRTLHGRTAGDWSSKDSNIRTANYERSPVRQYYSTRNYIYMMRKTFDRPDLARREVIRAIGRSVQAWLRNPVYGFKFTRYQLKAVVDGYLTRMGKTVSLG